MDDGGCTDGASTPVATIGWENPGVLGSAPATDSTYVRVSNTTDGGLYARVLLRAQGADGNAYERTLDYVTIDPRDHVDVPFRWEDLPLQSATSTVLVSAFVELIEGSELSPEHTGTQIPSSTLAYAFYWDFANVHFYGHQEEPTSLFYGSTTEQDILDRLTYWDAEFYGREGWGWDGAQFVDLTPPRPAPLGGEGFSQERANRLSFADTATFDQLTKSPVRGPIGDDRFCFRMPASYVDAAFGETVAAAKGLQYLPTAYMRVRIYTRHELQGVPFEPPSVIYGLLAQHLLDSDGCTLPLDLPADTYVVMLTSEIVRGDMTIQVRDANDLASSMWTSTVRVDPHIGPVIIPASIGKEGTGTRAAAAIAQVAAAPRVRRPSAPTGQTLPPVVVLSDKACVSYANGGNDSYDAPACAGASVLKLGPNAAGIPHNTAWKYVVAHEVGHFFQSATAGLVSDTAGYGWSPPAGTPPRCTTEAVTDESDKLHSLISLEHTPMSINEAFAHHIANLTWNGSSSAGTFVYYKPINKRAAAGGSVLYPPFGVSAGDRIKWRDTECASVTDRGATSTEWDWMNFFWELEHATNGTTSHGMIDVFHRACDNATCDGDAENFATLREAASDIYGPTSARSIRFAAAGVDHGLLP